MKHTTRNRRRWLTRVALGLAVVAVAAPAAQGMVQAETTGSAPDSGQVVDGLGRPLDPALVRSGEQVPQVVVDTSKFRIDAQNANEPLRPDDRPVRPTAEVVDLPGGIVDLPGGIVVATPDPISRVAGPMPGDTTLVPDQTPTAVRPDDRAIRPTIVGAGLNPVVAPPSRVPGPAARDTSPGDQPQAVPVSGPSFDWSDAGVGIGIGIAACLALLVTWMLLGGRKPDRLAGA
jgi:hypothetical protein